jgi:hypothetical protein
VNLRDGILVEFAAGTGDLSPRFTLFQQKLAISLTRKSVTP